MTPKQILDGFSETLMRDERILSPQERALLASLLQHAKTASPSDPEIHSAVKAVIASAVGETVAHRAFAVLGSSIIERMAADASGQGGEDRTIYAMHQTLGPNPPVPRPPGTRPPVPQPPGVSVPKPPVPQPPGVSVPKPPVPQPPGRSLEPLVGELSGDMSDARSEVGILDRPEIIPAQCVVLDEFLAPQELKELLGFTLAHEADFRASEVISPAGGVIDYQHRRSHVLDEVGSYNELILQRIKAVLPSVLRRLNLAECPISRTEVQLTASNDGDSFAIHTDDGHDEVASRYLTFVYFFHREPKQFVGGELRIHDSRLQETRFVSEGSYQTIVPEENQIVFFPCALLHEITPVECSSRAFADSRFTLNGWIHR
jgi:Rps23 Pro-64 3,4-dihydroxylase Tpa1-like proline 4-hydroxylase